MKKVMPIIVGSFFLVGCATTRVGHAIDHTQIDKIKEGTTTEQEVSTLLGAPQQKGIMQNGKVAYTYSYTEVQQTWSGSDVKNDSVVILFDENNKVEKVVKNNVTTPVRVS